MSKTDVGDRPTRRIAGSPAILRVPAFAIEAATDAAAARKYGAGVEVVLLRLRTGE